MNRSFIHISKNFSLNLFYWFILFFAVLGLIANFNQGTLQFLMGNFALPSSYSEFVTKPWTLLSYALVHTSFFHILGNILLLKYTVSWTENSFKYQYVQNVFFSGIIAGAIFFMLFSTKAPHHVLIGLSAGNMALLFMMFFHYPNFIALHFGSFSLKIKWLVLILMCIQLFGILDGSPVSWQAHFGGIFAALIGSITYMNQMPEFLINIIDWFKNLFKPKSKLKMVHKSVPRDDHDYNDKKVEELNELNRILDKINAKGYEKITKAEKEFLFRMKKKD